MQIARKGGVDCPGSLTIALAAPADAREILALYRSCVGLSGCTWNEDYPAPENIRADIAERSLYCARWPRAGGAIIAAAYVGPAEAEAQAALSWPPLRRPFALARLAVLPQWQGCGLGAQLLRAMLAAARERGADGVRLLVAPENAAARAMYLRAGFAAVGAALVYGRDYLCYQRPVREEDLHARRHADRPRALSAHDAL